VLVVDEDVLMELDGDARLKQLDRDKLERIKEQVVDNLMETWQDCLADAVNAVMGEAPETFDPEVLHEDRYDELEGGESYT
jgi:hypothetical protein